MWSHVRAARFKYYNMTNNVEKCQGFLSEQKIIKNYEILASILKSPNMSNTSTFEVEKSRIKEAGEMFVYLNSCPSALAHVYNYLVMSSGSVSELVQTTIKLLKSAKNENKRKMANALVRKIAVECGFQFNQPIEKNLNTFFWEKNILKVKGMYVVALIDIIILEVTRNHKQINSFYKD